ncbi:MAG: hypothetical protein IT184_08305 [Acidobacteria bacterium]|nr:hypothetical protein [Acidobacteriota bacterium]
MARGSGAHRMLLTVNDFTGATEPSDRAKERRTLATIPGDLVRISRDRLAGSRDLVVPAGDLAAESIVRSSETRDRPARRHDLAAHSGALVQGVSSHLVIGRILVSPAVQLCPDGARHQPGRSRAHFADSSGKRRGRPDSYPKGERAAHRERPSASEPASTEWT